ncbi:MAG: metallophosphoesterase [Proteobacteria bacterium]|nr:metallophosphoesterase [Pseudomonadota bacterium]
MSGFVFVYVFAIAVGAGGCLRDGRARALIDGEIGIATESGVSFAVGDGLAHVRAIEDGRLDLWASAPAFELIANAGSGAATEWIIEVDNCMPGAEMVAASSGAPLVIEVLEADPRPVLRRWRVRLPDNAETRLRIAPPDADSAGMWRFAVMGDIQEALDRVDEVFARINRESGVRFVVSTGDLVDRGTLGEYETLQLQYRRLDIPYYTTIGNHELYADHERWSERFGRFNVHFQFKEVTFSLIDSGSASIDPVVYGWIDQWLERAANGVHVVATHYPPIDPVGIRSGSFRSRKEAAKFLSKLASGRVDMTFYGHIHSYYEFSNAGMPAYISGGGGALPERLDGIGRHFLTVDMRMDGIERVDVVRVD